MAVSNLTDVLNGEDTPTVEAIAAVNHFTKTEQGTIDLLFTRSAVELLEVSSWSFVTTTITLNVLSGHGIIATDTIWLQGLVSTTNTPNGEWTVTSVTATTIVFTATSTPTGTPTVLNAIVYKTTYVDADAVGANPTAKLYHDGTIIGSTDNGSYTKYVNGDLECIWKKGSLVTTTIAYGNIWYIGETPPLYPIPFIDLYVLTPSGEGAGGAAWGSTEASASLIQPIIRYFGAVNTATQSPAYTAKGTWK